MKRLVLAAVLAAALSTAACSTVANQSPVTQAIASGLPHCHVTGSINAGAGGLAGTGTGLAQNFTFDCPAQPWASADPAVAK